MKRFIVVLVILVLLAGTGFGFGYVQLRLDAAEVGVLFSRTSGWDDTVYRAGGLSWRWQLLIPRNARLLRFPIEPRRVAVSSNSYLPSADLYASYLEGEPSLAHTISLTVSYRPLPETPAVLAPLGIQPDTFEDWLVEQDDRIRVEAIDQIGRASERGVTGISDIAQWIHDALAAANPQIEIVSVYISEILAPDRELYDAGRAAYMEVQDARRRVLAEEASVMAREEARATSQVDTLRRYGAILTEYPVLLDYVRISAETGADPLEIGLPAEITLPPQPQSSD